MIGTREKRIPCAKRKIAQGEHDALLRRAAAMSLVLAVTFAVTALCLGAAGKFGTSRGFSDAGAEAVDAIRKNEALAVFLGWEPEDEAVPTALYTDGVWLPDPPESGGLSFWDCFAAVIAKLLVP